MQKRVLCGIGASFGLRPYMKILLGDFNEKLGREDICKPTIGNESLHQESNDGDDRIVTLPQKKFGC